MLFSFLGLVTYKFRHALIVVSYGLCGFILTGIYVCAAICLVYVYMLQPIQIQNFCDGTLKSNYKLLQT